MNIIKQTLFSILIFSSLLLAQNNSDKSIFQNTTLEYRNIGPFRGGRSAAVTGVPSNPNLFYMGGTGGGVWKTINSGTTWECISDGFFGGSIGAIAVSEWDPNVIYVGGGEVTVRGNVSHGSGMWKSLDAGKTWKSVGLKDSRRIPRIQIHPKNPDIVYAAVMGHLFGSNKERGVYRSKDGGISWQKILFVNDKVGAVDLEMDPINPRILFASMWKIKRTPYSLESGGEGSSIWKSVDGGDTWKEITHNEGLPKGTIGISGITVSPVNHNRVWTIIEANDGGVFRSDDGGEKWIKINDERKLRQRAWYYTRIYADTKDSDMVYVLNVRFWRSKDGGKTYKRISTPHGDHHDLWLNTNNNNIMIVADDGGAQVSVDAGKSFSTYHNQPTAQFYRVTTDNYFPYRIYGAQQDNSTVRIPYRTEGSSIDESDWESTAGGESGWIAPHPIDPNIVYGGSYHGFLTRVNHKTKEVRSINIYPEDNMGHGAVDAKYRFQWTFPIIISKHDPNVIYSAGNVLFKSTNEGQSWQPISKDLTRNDPSRLQSSGGLITQDNTSVEYYCTIFSIAESNFDKNVIWTGSDDGLIYITKDQGKTWKNVSPDYDLLPEWAQINNLEADPFNPGGLYAACTRYKSDDFRPYILRTNDFGESWDLISDGIPEDHFTRVVRADKDRKGLLYAGTENGMYVSFNDGNKWEPFQLNLPIVPITDLTIKNKDLIVATQGRSFWILDDLTPLHQWSKSIDEKSTYLYSPRETYRLGGRKVKNLKTAGINSDNGVVINYFFMNKPDSNNTKINILESNGDLIKSYKPKSKEKGDRINCDKGMNKFVWNMRYASPDKFKGLITWGGGLSGPKAVPGKYIVELISDTDTLRSNFIIKKDPRVSVENKDLQEQFDLLIELRNKISETHNAIKKIRDIKKQINSQLSKITELSDSKDLTEFGKEMVKQLTLVEEELYQTKNRSAQDPLNFPVKLNNKLTTLASSVSMGDNRPTDQSYDVKKDLFKKVDNQLSELKKLIETSIPKFNSLIKNLEVPAIIIK